MGQAHLNGERRGAVAEVDGLFGDGHVAPFAVPLVLERVIRIDGNGVEVLYVGFGVGHAPRDVGVVPDDHAGRGREREADYVQRTGIGHRLAVKPDLVPDRRHLNAEVRIVGEQGRAAGGHAAGGDPVVAAHPGIAAEGEIAGAHVARHQWINRVVNRQAAARLTAGGAGVADGQVFGVEDGRAVAVVGPRRREIHRHVASEGLKQGLPGVFVSGAVGEVPRHHLAPHQRIGGRPRLNRDVHPGHAQ